MRLLQIIIYTIKNQIIILIVTAVDGYKNKTLITKKIVFIKYIKKNIKKNVQKHCTMSLYLEHYNIYIISYDN